DFARKRAPLTVLGDTTGLTPSASSFVEAPWSFAYEWPIDAVQGRWMPWTPTNGVPVSGTGVPLTTGPGPNPIWPVAQPARFLISAAPRPPCTPGPPRGHPPRPPRPPPGPAPPAPRVPLGPGARRPGSVSPRLVTIIEEWDRLFREAMVMMMAMAIAPTVN